MFATQAAIAAPSTASRRPAAALAAAAAAAAAALGTSFCHTLSSVPSPPVRPPQAVRRGRNRMEEVTGVEPPLPRARKGLVAWIKTKVCGSPAASGSAPSSGEAVAASPAAMQAETTVA